MQSMIKLLIEVGIQSNAPDLKKEMKISYLVNVLPSCEKKEKY